MDSVFLSDSGLSLTHVLKSIDLRFQNECNSLLPSKPAVLPPSSSEEGKGLRRSLAPSERELSPKVTEGEKPIDRCTTQFLQLCLMAAKTSLACAHSCRAQATARQQLAVSTADRGSSWDQTPCVWRGSSWQRALPAKKGHSINYRMSFIESGGDLPSRAVASQVLSAC